MQGAKNVATAFVDFILLAAAAHGHFPQTPLFVQY
jgi:hypothetical protein